MTKNLIYLLVFAFVFAFASCDKGPSGGGSSSGVSINAISAKWEILDSNSPYASFEFNKDGNYIVVENVEAYWKSSGTNLKNSLIKSLNFGNATTRISKSESGLSSVHFGTYRIEGNKIILLDFGVINVITITDKEFSFSLTLDTTGETEDFVAGKSDEPIESTNRTDMLCRTWVLEKLTYEGETFYSDAITVLFSRAGTYLVSYVYEGETGLSEWKWANSQETQLYYSWDNWTDDWNNNIVTITELTNTSLVIDEDGMISYLKLKK
jgi:hypothetical protein